MTKNAVCNIIILVKIGFCGFNADRSPHKAFNSLMYPKTALTHGNVSDINNSYQREDEFE